MEFDEALEDFTPPRQGEVTFGIASRFFAHAHAKNSQKVHDFLFGYSTEEIASKYPGGLAELFRRLEGAWQSPRDILYLHTNYPLYRAFMNSETKANEIEETLIKSKSNPGKILRKKFQLAEHEALEKRQYPRLCVACMNEDVSNELVPTWYRQHQIPGVNWCTKHEIALTDNCINCGEIFFKHTYVLPAQKYICPGQLIVKGKRITRSMDYSTSEDVYRVRNASDAQDLNYSRFVVAILEENLNPIAVKNWVDVISAGIEMHGVKSILTTLKASQIDGINIKSITTIHFEALIRIRRQSQHESYIRELSAEDKIKLVAAIFESPKEFLTTLKQVHMDLLYAY